MDLDCRRLPKGYGEFCTLVLFDIISAVFDLCMASIYCTMRAILAMEGTKAYSLSFEAG